MDDAMNKAEVRDDGTRQRLSDEAALAFSIAAVRSWAAKRCPRANAGTGIVFWMFLTYGMRSRVFGLKSPRSTRDEEWLVRVVMRIITGTWNCSEISKAACVMS